MNTILTFYNVKGWLLSINKAYVDASTNSNQQIPWTITKGMRNRLIHEYFGTDLPVVWNVIKEDLPSFKADLQIIYKRLIGEGR